MTQTDQQNVPKLRFLAQDGDSFSDWEEKRLGEVADIRTGKKDVNEGNPEGAYPFFTCAKKHTYSDSFSFDTDAILIAGNGEVGHCQRYSGKFEAYQRTYVLSDFKTSFDYLYAYMSTKFVDYVQSQKQMGAMPYIKLGALKNFPIPLPHPEEQRKIAGFLGAVDTKIAQLAEKKRLLEDYKKGCMQQLFSQKIRFKDDDGNNFPDWEEKRLGEVFAEIADGGTPSKSVSSFFGGDVPWVVIEDIQPRIKATKNTLTSKGLSSSSAKLWPAGSLILSTGATIGRVGIAEIPLATKQGICGIVPSSGINNVWLYFLLHTLGPKLERLAQGNTIKEVRAPTIKKIEVSLPHPAEQRKIADFLSALDRKIDLVGQELEHARTFKQGLLQQMFV